jgi:hypothetical protein
MPVPNELHIDRYLTNVSIDYMQSPDAFVAPQVFPVVPVAKQSDKYVVYDRASFWRDNMPKRPLGGRADVAEWGFGEGSYFAEERALAHKLDDRQRANTDEPINQDTRITKLLTERAMVEMDRRWAQSFFRTGIWATDVTGTTTGSGADEFVQFDQSDSDPIAIIDELKERMARNTARTPNRMVVGARTHRILRNHPEILERIKYTQRGVLPNDLLASMFEVERYVVARSVYNAAPEGLAADYDFIVPDDGILLVHAASTPAIDTPSAGYVFAWTGLDPQMANPMGTAIYRGRDEFAHSDHFEIRKCDDMKLVASDLGIYMGNVISTPTE